MTPMTPMTWPVAPMAWPMAWLVACVAVHAMALSAASAEEAQAVQTQTPTQVAAEAATPTEAAAQMAEAQTPTPTEAATDVAAQTAEAQAAAQAAAEDALSVEPDAAVSSRKAFTATPLERYDTAIAAYERLAAAGGWEATPTDMAGLSYGDVDSRMPLLRARLAAEGDLRPRLESASTEASPDLFDAGILDGVMRFQRRRGLSPHGRLDSYTIYEMNKPVSVRLESLRLNRARLAALQDSEALRSQRHVFVNVASARLEAVERDRVALDLRVIVGNVNTPTPRLVSAIGSVRFFPQWTAPYSVTRRVLLPALQRDPDHFEKNGIHVYRAEDGVEVDPRDIDWSEEPVGRYVWRQDAGDRNVLGLLKIDFPNEHAVYLHDTPARALFERFIRGVSAGCVRVDRMVDLVAWLLADKPKWTRRKIEETLAERDEIKSFSEPLGEPIPIILGYYTAWVDERGEVAFLPDPYGLDIEDEATPQRGEEGDDIAVAALAAAAASPTANPEAPPRPPKDMLRANGRRANGREASEREAAPEIPTPPEIPEASQTPEVVASSAVPEASEASASEAPPPPPPPVQAEPLRDRGVGG